MDFNDLDEAQKESLLINGMNLMRTVTEIWGADRGMELWDNIATHVGQDFKGACFFNMLTGQYQGDVHLSNVSQTTGYVEVIKVVRNFTGYGLKDAKDVCDIVRGTPGKTVKLPCDPGQRPKFVKALRDIGCTAQ